MLCRIIQSWSQGSSAAWARKQSHNKTPVPLEPPSTLELSPEVNIQKEKPICWAEWERIPLLFLLRENTSPQQGGSIDVDKEAKSHSLCVLRSFSAVCPGAKLSPTSLLFPVQVLSWASGYLQAASANELLAGKQLFLDPLQEMQETRPT